MSFYKKIANIKDDEAQEMILEEMLNRFGKVPEEVVNLVEVAKLKFLCKKNNILSLEANKDGIMLAFKNNRFKDVKEFYGIENCHSIKRYNFNLHHFKRFLEVFHYSYFYKK